ncbi:hypothetical protein GQ53DRAFT_34232 [Thozetella sp. PMI_491]|nr:hypothetical protein GQ53DRAFT_34232 [Thozetella sp. PMI_491]
MPSMLRKKEVFTVITPIPGFIPRQLALDILHAHSEVITLNPLVVDHKPIPAPPNAEADEYYSTWYEISQKVQFVPGIGKMGSGSIKFNGCFHDMPWGLQTHVYAPMNVDLRNKYRIAGNQPGFEPPEPIEMGLKALGAPSDGLYLHEDIEIKCNVTVMSFVKAQTQKAGGEMVKRIIKKAELLDAGVLQAMIEGGKLKTINPADRSNGVKSPLPSPTQLHHAPSVHHGSPVHTVSSAHTSTPPPQPGSPGIPYQVPRPMSYQAGYRPNTPGSQYGGSQYGSQYGGTPYSAYAQPATPYGQHPHPGYGPPMPVEMPAQEIQSQQQITFEMAGDFYHPGSQPAPLAGHSPSLRHSAQPNLPSTQPPSNRDSHLSTNSDPNSRFSPDPSQSGRWSTGGGRPTSVPSLPSQQNGFHSPGLDHKGFSSELETHKEETDEHRDEALRKLDPRIPHPSHAPYNPADYAQVREQHRQMHPGQGPQGKRYQYSQ